MKKFTTLLFFSTVSIAHQVRKDSSGGHVDLSTKAYHCHDTCMDFVLISAHLKPGSGPSVRTRLKHELELIYSWINGDK